MSPYAEGTTVDSAASRAEIERTLTRYGATSFMYGWENNRAVIGFVTHGRQVRFVLPLPDRESRAFTHTPGRGQKRSEQAAATEYEKAVRQRWRALALVVKAKLEAVSAGIFTFDEEFLAHMVLPNGKSVYQEVATAIDTAYTTGKVGTLLQIEATK